MRIPGNRNRLRPRFNPHANPARTGFLPLIAAAMLFAGATCAWAQGYAPEEAVRRMTLPEGFTAQLVAAEPLVRQPVAMNFDDRGRLWVIQYLQYPNPAGLTRVSVDRYSRTEYDRVPEPPPPGPRGADRVTILEDTDGDGRADQAKDFVDGLNLATGLALGRDGVYVAQAPYLLFYPDRNRDDVPDGEPEVLLSGFGMQDAHALVNSLTWGPDGWLYGAQGSTVTANIRGISFQQGVWRYHPVTREFELFAEGGGNTWGLDFDRHGQLIVGTNYGGFACLHQVQGGYYWKSFEKHGELQNKYAFGYLDHVPYHDYRGGHVTCGGIVYQGNTYPREYVDSYIAANLLSHAVHMHRLKAIHATFKAGFGGELLNANDDWFAPVDCALGPDGSVYVADWHDQRTAHPDPDAQWDRTNGRIFKVVAAGTPKLTEFDLANLSSDELLALLSHANGWQRAEARRLLIERDDERVRPKLVALARDRDDEQLALTSLWILGATRRLDDFLAIELLARREPAIREWVVRFWGDSRQLTPGQFAAMLKLAESERSAVVRSQLACTAKRLPAEQALPLVAALARLAGAANDQDAVNTSASSVDDPDDKQFRLLLWWALEAHATEYDKVLATLETTKLWPPFLIEWLARRWSAAATDPDWQALARLWQLTAQRMQLEVAVRGAIQGVKGHAYHTVPAPLRDELARHWETDRSHALVELAARLGFPPAHAWLLAKANEHPGHLSRHDDWIWVFAETADAAQAVPILLTLACEGVGETQLRPAVLAQLARFDNPAIAERVLATYDQQDQLWKSTARGLLVSRASWAAKLLDAVDAGSFPADAISADDVRRMAQHHDATLDARLVARFGRFRESTPEERLAVVRRLNNDLRAGTGDPERGRTLFKEHCGTCHRLFGEGNQIGPDLTSANRGDRQFLLTSLVDPSDQVRKEYLSHQAQLRDGRVLVGLVIEQSAESIMLVDAKNERTVVARGDIDVIEPAEKSLMPEGIVEKLSPAQLRDLFSYLERSAPLEQPAPK
jgi:putative membrane-bound dehydrogenase-like protein